MEREAFNRLRSPGARAWWGARAEPWAPMVVGGGGIRYLADTYLPTTAGRSQADTLPSHKIYTLRNCDFAYTFLYMYIYTVTA